MGPTVRSTGDDYAELVDAVRAVVGRLIPSDAVVAVVSRGDEALLELDVADARHFPGDAHGAYTGYYPRDDDDAIEQLEQMRAGGAEFIVFPVTAFWWLEHYFRFGEHLDRYALLADHQGKYMIWDLREQLVPATVQLRKKRPESGGAARPRSMMRRADEVLGYGGQHRTALRPFYGESGGDVLPSFAVAADGYELVDSAGRSFVDWIGGGGPVLLGYRHPAVEEAIKSQLAAGPTLTLMHTVEVEVASMLKEMIPCAEMVAFGKNGSDALAGAIRVARAATGRDVLLQHGMHGFHEWFACMHPGVKGIPNVMRALVHPLPFNDLDGLAALFDRFEGEVAAVVMEPATSLLPEPGYLEGVRDLAHAHGALLVFDEMVTGFRFANGGGQELYGVTPDLACFGKGLANGMPLSAIVGKREYMELLTRVAYGMTFRGETLSLAAARAVLETLADEPVAERIAHTGAILRDEFQQACTEAGISARLLGHESRLSFVFDQHAGVSHEQASAIFIRECARAGVLTNGTLLPSLAHDDDAIRRTAAAFRSAAGEVAKIAAGGHRVLGDAVRAGFADEVRDGLPAGYLDSAREEGAGLVLRGWILLADGPPDAVELVAAGGEIVAAEACPRPDIVIAFPAAPGAEGAGFAASLPARKFAPAGDYEFTLRARRGDREVLRCPIVRRRDEHGDPAHQPWLGSDGVLHL